MHINNNEGEKMCLLAEAIIYAQQDEYTFLKTSLVTMNDGQLISYGSIIDKYMKFIEENSYSIKFTDEERAKYKFNPKRLSSDMYGTTRMFFIILAVNKIKSKIEFDRSNILLPKPNALKEIIEQIKIKEQLAIDINRDKIGI
ncbi:MAG: hypothetical protein ACRC0G_07400 [Fusobacteriaceae bacterium]